MLVAILAASLLGSALAAKIVIRAGERVTATSRGRKANIPGRGTIRAGQDF